MPDVSKPSEQLDANNQLEANKKLEANVTANYKNQLNAAERKRQEEIILILKNITRAHLQNYQEMTDDEKKAWDALIESAKKAGGTEVMAYNSGHYSSFMAMIGLAIELQKAGHLTLYKHLSTLDNIIATLVVSQLLKLGEYANKISQIEIPALTQSVSIDDKGNLTVSLKDSIESTEGNYNQLFEMMVEDWLDKKDYKRGTTDKTKGQFFKDNVLLTKVELNKIKVEGDDSLSAYLNKHLKVPVKEAPTEKPQPATSPRL
jgi:hypothetical protein